MSDKDNAKKNLKAVTVAACYVIGGASVVDAAINTTTWCSSINSQ